MNNDLSQDPELVKEFLVESEEGLQRMDQDMVALEATPNDSDLLNRIFRALHTIKGTSGFLGFDPIVRVSHRAEDVLNKLRNNELQLSKRIIDVLLRARDQLGRMLSDIRNSQLGEYDLDSLLQELVAVQTPGASGSKAEAPASSLTPQAAPPVASEVKTSPAQPRQDEAPRKEVPAAPAAPAPTPAAPAPDAAGTKKQESALVPQTMRVDVQKLDELINLIGELVLERNRLVQVSKDLTAGRLSAEKLESALTQSTARLSFLTEELHDAGLKTRMVPVDTVFRKFTRIVRDIAGNLKKEVELVIQGQDTELDKTMVELIGDPLVHLVRNSLDHGLETPQARVATGKSSKGTIRLEAREEGDQIVISVSDDGAGIDPEKVARKAVEKGLVSSERVRSLSKKEILEFIFLPGFSTREIANDVSGRGVGMDVVNTNVKAMNGTIELDSTIGQGTCVTLRLPLTLAILPVLFAKVGEEVYGLPMRTVVESLRVQSDQIHTVEGREVIHLRDRTVPLIRLSRVLEVDLANQKPPELCKAVIVNVGARRLALMVDDLLGGEETVIKPLDEFLRRSTAVAGATITGDGMVRLLLDPASLVDLAEAETKPEAQAAHV